MLNVGIFCFQMTFAAAVGATAAAGPVRVGGADGGGPDCPDTATFVSAAAAAFVSIAIGAVKGAAAAAVVSGFAVDDIKSRIMRKFDSIHCSLKEKFEPQCGIGHENECCVC